MKIIVKGRDTAVTPALQEYAEQRLIRLEKLIEFDEISVVLKVSHDKHRAEITLPLAGAQLRAEQESFDMYNSIDQAAEKLERRIERYKAKWGKKGRDTLRRADAELEPEAEEQEKPLRVKSFPIEPMPVEEAIQRMELVGHSFFAFVDAESGSVNVVYKRNDGGYGLLQPEL